MTQGQYDEAKTAELLLFVAQRTEQDETAGQTKLHKILYFSDRAHLVRHGSTITDADYRRSPRGPTLRRMLPIIENLEGRGDIKVVERQYFGNIQRRLLVLREPNLSKFFTPEEIATVDSLILQFWGKSAKETSELSHEDAGWLSAEEGEPIFMKMAFIGEPEITDQIREKAERLAKQHG